LQRDLGEVEERLTSLQEEQEQEKRMLEEELAQLTEKMERVRQTSREAEEQALRDQMDALERQRDGTMFSIDAWLREVGTNLDQGPLDQGPSRPGSF